jgi:hypothetical protein
MMRDWSHQAFTGSACWLEATVKSGRLAGEENHRCHCLNPLIGYAASVSGQEALDGDDHP